MNCTFCNVALAVPLRTTFTYAIPEALCGTLQPGSRVLVPFRKKAMVGVVVEFAESVPAGTKIREITRILDFVPALTPKLIELGEWIAGYYLAPVGEVFRAMLPPLTELRTQRQILLTEPGRAAAQSLGGGEISHALTKPETTFLAKLNNKKGAMLAGSAAKSSVGAASLERLRQLGLIEIRESILGRTPRTQRIVAWPPEVKSSQESATELPDEKLMRVKI